jgi:hypothetical protein
MVKSHAAAGAAISGNGPHAAAEATEAATAAPRRIAGAPTRGCEPTHEAAMSSFAKSWRREVVLRSGSPLSGQTGKHLLVPSLTAFEPKRLAYRP